jgi:hypothetical protein
MQQLSKLFGRKPKATLTFDDIEFDVEHLKKLHDQSPGSAVDHIVEKTGMTEDAVKAAMQGLVEKSKKMRGE